MRYVKQSTASEDTVQLFNSSGVPVNGISDSDIIVEIRKEGASGFSSKTMSGANWTDRSGVTPGNYLILFSTSDFDTLGDFRYRIRASVPGTFIDYEDVLSVVETLPSEFSDPPVISPQTASPPGITPDPVARGATLTINGTDLAGATDVSIGGVSLTITSTSSSQIQATVVSGVALGTDQSVSVTTPGGTVLGLVDVVLPASAIPGSGLCAITGTILSPGTGQPVSGVGIRARMLDMPNIIDGVMWTDEVLETTTDTNGFFSISLPRQRRCEVIIRQGRYRREFDVPNVATADLFTEIPEF